MRTGLKFALLLPLFALMAPTGGFPSRPIFQGVNIGTNNNAVLAAPGANRLTLANQAGSDTMFFFDGSQLANQRIAAIQWAGHIMRFNGCPDTVSGCTTAASLDPTSGDWTFGPAVAGTTMSVTGLASNNAVVVLGAPSTGSSFGVNVQAGSNASDYNLNLQTFSGTTLMKVNGDGGVTLGTGPTGGDKGAGTLNSQGGIYVNNLALFPVVAVVLSSDSVKTSNTTQALDATLQLTIPAAGTYMIELNGAIVPAGIAAGAGGFAGCLQYSGTVAVLSAATYSAALFVTNVAFSNQWLVEQQMVSSCTGGSQVVYTSQTVGGTFDQLAWRGVLTTSTGGTFGLSWAQSSSSATPTTLKQGMVLSATRIL